MLPAPAVAIIMALAYGLADRFAGGGSPKLDDRLPWRAAFWGALFCAGVGFLTLGWPGAAMALVWLAWRTPGWKAVPGASATPHGAKEIVATFLRHAIPIVGAFIVAKGFGLSVLPLVLAMALFAASATALAALYAGIVAEAARTGASVKGKNARLEVLRGVAYGAALVAGFSL
jgi:hypothetical protein